MEKSLVNGRYKLSITDGFGSFTITDDDTNTVYDFNYRNRFGTQTWELDKSVPYYNLNHVTNHYHNEFKICSIKYGPDYIRLQMEDNGCHVKLSVKFNSVTDGIGQFEIRISAEGEINRKIEYPYPMSTKGGDTLLTPIGEGLALPVDDPAVTLQHSERPFCSRMNTMGFWGYVRCRKTDVFVESRDVRAVKKTEKQAEKKREEQIKEQKKVQQFPAQWIVFALEKAYDGSSLLSGSSDGYLVSHLLWDTEFNKWGYERSVRIIAGNGNAVNAVNLACKAYRKYRMHINEDLFITLTKKAEKVTDLNKMMGAAAI